MPHTMSATSVRANESLENAADGVRAEVTPGLPRMVADHLDIFMCPVCGSRLTVDESGRGVRCATCARSFVSCDRIPLFFWPTEGTTASDVTDIVKAFYEETPFPNYDDMDSAESLRAKAERGLFARALDEHIPHGSTIVEYGCGTGQLSNFLGLTWGRLVFGTDMCMNSLRLASGFKERHGIANVCFLQANLFRPIFRPETVDFVISNGVLHHTSDPVGGFRSILACLKKGGFIIVGLYNTYGRLTTDVRRLIFRATGKAFTVLDPRLRVRTLGDVRKHTWFKDQYQHPHESKHSFGEVLRWFDQCGVEFINSIPPCRAGGSPPSDETLFEPHQRGSARDRVLAQLGMLLGGGREGGFFVMIGRKKA